MQSLPNLKAYVEGSLSGYDEEYFRSDKISSVPVDDYEDTYTILDNFQKRHRVDNTGPSLMPSIGDYNQMSMYPFHPMVHALAAQYCMPIGLPMHPPSSLPVAMSSSSMSEANTDRKVIDNSKVHWSKTHEIERSDHPSEDSPKTRRNRGDCRFCPCRSNGKRVSRVTTFRCKECKTYLHPECFMKYHRRKYDQD